MSTRLVGLAVLLAACGKDSQSAAPPTPTPTPVTQPAKAVDLYVDNTLAGHIAPAQLAQWPRLDTLVPLNARRIGTWDDVYIHGNGTKPAELHRISDQHPDLVPALFAADDGSPSFGLFDPVELGKHGKPQIREDGVSEIRIKLAQNSGRGEHESGEGGGADPAQLVVTIVTPAGT